MTGLDKILNHIEEDAKSSADKLIEDARHQAEAILAEAEKTSAEQAEASKAAASAAARDIEAKGRSAAQMQKKRRLLAVRQELIGSIIEKAHQSLHTLDDGPYFELLARMLDQFVLEGTGEIRLSARDLDRLPRDFQRTISAAAGKKGGTLTLSHTPCDIDGGFLLIYGGIEENCSFDAIFSAEQERLQDLLHTFLFSDPV